MGGGGNHRSLSGNPEKTLLGDLSSTSNDDCASSNTHQSLSQGSARYSIKIRQKNGLPRNVPSKEDGVDEMKRNSTYLELVSNYERNSNYGNISANLQLAKLDIRSYTPGQWIEPVGDKDLYDYDVPRTTTLLLVGPRGSGKSSLVNRISTIFEEQVGFRLPDRAQESYNLSTTNGTCFLQEYMIPRHSKSFCIYDSRSLSTNSSDNFELLKMWMTRGVRHGEMVLRDTDSSATNLKTKAKMLHGYFPCETRKVNFVIFVVNGASVLKSMHNDNEHYTNILVETFNFPFLSFKDSRPVVVVTHGDQLSFSERAQVCSNLGELLGIPPTKQIFDIPDTINAATELAIVDMLRYSLEQADRNLPFKQSFLEMTEVMFQRSMDELQNSIPWISVSHLVFAWLIIALICLFAIYML